MALKIPAYLQGFSSKTDGSASLRFSTQELSSDDFALLQKHLNLFGWLLFAESDLKVADIPKEEIHEDESKSPSKRLRAVLYILHSQGNKELSFEEFYRRQMDKIIEHIKTKLE